MSLAACIANPANSRTGSLILLCLICMGAFANVQARCTTPIATLTSLQGQVEIRADSDSPWRTATLNDALCAGEELRTRAFSRAQLRLHQSGPDPARDGTLMQLNEQTAVVLPTAMEPWWVRVARGAMHILTRTPQRLTIRTLFCNANVDGTEFLVEANAGNSRVTVYEGRVSVSNDQGNVHLGSGDAAVAEPNRPPRRMIPLRPRDAVQWALYYPPVVDPRLFASGSNAAFYGRVLAEQRDGHIASAIAHMNTLPATQRDAMFHTLRAALSLSVGQVAQAQADLDTVQARAPQDPHALALQSIIALAQNNRTRALELARRAIASAPHLATPYVAESYALQADFRLTAALHSARTASRHMPENALAWTRIAELELALGNLASADETVRHARTLDPTSARAQTVAGFIALSRIKPDRAMRAFQAARQRDPADPLPQVGWGLAKIRRGDLQAGRQAIEEAANSDPDNALVRSYLGKAYYEEKRNEVAVKELDNAKALDPNDPTPWFYGAILKQTQNRPGEALLDLQKSIVLNRQRAVYRSTLALDDDLAARNATIGRIYGEVGFQSRALSDGWRALAANPGNAAAHRLLSDTYSALPRHEVARVSELLQSQLLTPLNVTPIQPQLSLANLAFVGGIGPATSGLNEFNPLFERPRYHLLLSGLAGTHSTFGDEVVHSGQFQNFVYSLGQLHYSTDGRSNNDDAETNVYNAFAQLRPSDWLSVQLEARHREDTYGDLVSRFVPPQKDTGSAPLRNAIEARRYRAGFLLSPSAHSRLISSLSYVDNRILTTEGPVIQAGDRFTGRGYSLESQYLYATDRLTVQAGGGYNAATYVDEGSPARGDSDGIAYIYTHLRLPAHIDWLLGASVDHFVRDAVSEDAAGNETLVQVGLTRVHPKFGLVWDLGPHTTLRAAAFTTLKRSIIANQTIEPTQIAGFNQFFDDSTSTQAFRYGIGLDQRLSPWLTFGVEASSRQLKVPVDLDVNRRREFLYRAYVNLLPARDWSLSLEYLREEFDNVDGRRPLDTITQFFPVSIAYFNSGGFYFKLKGTTITQEVAVDNGRLADDQAFFLDTVLGYRLPKRAGLLEFQVLNALDQRMRYEGLQNRTAPLQDGTPQITPFAPEITAFLRCTLAFDM